MYKSKLASTTAFDSTIVGIRQAGRPLGEKHSSVFLKAWPPSGSLWYSKTGYTRIGIWQYRDLSLVFQITYTLTLRVCDHICTRNLFLSLYLEHWMAIHHLQGRVFQLLQRTVETACEINDLVVEPSTDTRTIHIVFEEIKPEETESRMNVRSKCCQFSGQKQLGIFLPVDTTRQRKLNSQLMFDK